MKKPVTPLIAFRSRRDIRGWVRESDDVHIDTPNKYIGIVKFLLIDFSINNHFCYE